LENKNQSYSGGSLNASRKDPYFLHTYERPQSGRGLRRNNLKAKGESFCKHKKFWEL